ncbi:serine-rich adhesin for platelets-like [Panonychus citri]|uniref:serine-rich adhesin for platelets-like n=1 Tax=Panonychus citri TaxID=50023 RepID=UPI0023082538|nr:serine-rich adhesin for platelets-like [Panonychus citri]XP_053203930.1 serine-rich adhesin for platelets-like [Panonychus citri]
MNNLDEDESCLSSSSSLVENEVIVINGKIKPIPSLSSSSSSTTLSDHCVRIKLEDSSCQQVNHQHHQSLINQLGFISSNNQQSFRRNSHLNLSSDFCTDNNNNITSGNTNNNIGQSSINNINSNNSNNNNTNNSNNNNNHHNNSVVNQSNGKLSVQYISVSYNSTGLSNCSTITSSPAVSTLVSSSLSSSISSLSSNYRNDSNQILHPSAIKLEPLEIGGGEKGGYNSLTTNTITTSSGSSNTLGFKLESMSSISSKNLTSSSHLTDCFISCPVDDLDSVKSNLSLTHHSLHSHLNNSHSVTSNHHINHHHHHHHQRILISPTDFLSLTEESTSAVSAVKKDVNLSTSRLEIIKKSHDNHGLTMSLDRYCESPFLIDSHREIHLISDDDASNNGRASRLSETHEELPTEDLFASTLADDQHNAIREVVITPIEPDTTPLTLILDLKHSSSSPLSSTITQSCPSLSSRLSSSINGSTSLLTSVGGVLTTTTVSSSSMVNGFDLTLVKEEKFDEDESVEQMIVEEGAVDNDPGLINGMDDDVDDDVDLINSESRSASTSTVTTFSVLNTLHNNSSIRLTPEESSSSLELRPNPLTEQMNTPIPLQSSSLSSSSSSSSLASSSLTSSSLTSSSPPTLMAQIPSFSHFSKHSTSSLSSNGSGSLVQITLPPTPSSLATTSPSPNSILPTGTPLTPLISNSTVVGSSSSSSSLSLSSLSSPSSTSSTSGFIAVSTPTLSSSSPANNCVISNSGGGTLIGQNSIISTSSLSSLISSNSSSSTTISTSTAAAPSANVTLPLTPLDIKILPGGLLQFAANVAAVFPSSTILQKQLALQLLREDGTSIILPLTTRSSDSTSATIASGFSTNNTTNSGLGLTTTTTNHSIHANANNKAATTVSVLGNSGSLIGGAVGRAGSIVVAGGLGLGSGVTGGSSANLTEIPTLSTSQISLSNERFEQQSQQQQSQSQLIQQQQQQTIGTTTRDPINSTKLLTSAENPGQTTEIDRPFKCELCNSTFTRLGNYTRHKKIHSLPSKEDQRFRCDICGKSFIQRCDLARHLHIHRGTEPHRCSQCGKGYIRHSDLVTHQRFHNKEKPFACPHCSKGFCQRGDLNRHLRSIHLQLKPILCSHCHKKFAKEETLLRHINSNHRDTVVT